MALQRLQPKIKKIQELHKDKINKDGGADGALQRAWREPVSHVILLVVQLPILISLYRVCFRGSVRAAWERPISLCPRTTKINALFFHLIDLKQHSIILVLLAAAAQYFQARLAIYRSPDAGPPSSVERMARQMLLSGP